MKVSRFGGRAEPVAENVWGGFSLSPDEKQIAFVRSFPQENRQSVLVKNTGGEERELFALGAPQEFYLRAVPSWSADGKKIGVCNQQTESGFFEVCGRGYAERAGGRYFSREF